MKQLTIYLDDETLNRMNAGKGQLNKRVIELINRGLDTESREEDTQIVSDLVALTKRFVRLAKDGTLKISRHSQSGA